MEASQSQYAGELDEYLDCMVHWSRFAGSLWDNVLAAHVHSNNLAGQALTFNAAVDDFITNTFLGIGEHWPVFPYRRCQYVRLCFDNLILMAGRATISSLQLEGSISGLLQAAVTSMTHVRMHGRASTDAYLLRYQMVTTLAASLHLLSSALFSNQSHDDLDSRQWMSLGKVEFSAADDLLDTLAESVPLAQRVLSDFERMLPVVRHVFARLVEDPSSFQGTPSWTTFSDVIPPNAAELLPYREQVPDIRFLMLHNGMWATNGGYLETDRGLDTWDAGLEPGGPKSSVVWI
jgi:hypothetical protein